MFSFGVYIFTFFCIFIYSIYIWHTFEYSDLFVVDLDKKKQQQKKNYTGNLARMPHTVCPCCMCEGIFLSVAKQDGNVWSFCRADSGAGDRDAAGGTTKERSRDMDFVIWSLTGTRDRYPASPAVFSAKIWAHFFAFPDLIRLPSQAASSSLLPNPMYWS